MIITILLFALGLVFLIKGGDWFVEGASAIAEKSHMPHVLVGATVVSIGTTLPEVMVSASSALSGHGEIAYGNAIGSIICNTALIAALTIAVYPPKVERKTLVTPVFFFFMAAVFYSAVAYIKGSFSRVTGILLLVIFLIYMVVTVRQAFAEGRASEQEDVESADDMADTSEKDSISEEKNSSAISAWVEKNKENTWFLILLLVVGAFTIAIGANLLVDNGTLIAEYLGVPESVIAVTIVALGTSLPELVTAITSLVKGCGALSLGNVIGANLFNLVLVCGVSCTLSPFKVPRGNTFAGYPTSLILEIPLMLFVMAFLSFPALCKGKIKRYQGITLLVLYFLFVIFQFVA